MILYFANLDLDIIGSASTYSAGNYVVGDDVKKEDVDSGMSTFECKIYYTKDFRDEVKKLVRAGNKILRYEAKEYASKRKDNASGDISDVIGDAYSISGYEDYFTIIEVEEDRHDQTFYLYAESAGLDLLNNLVGAYSNTAKAYSVYVNATLTDTGFTLIDGVTDAQEKLLSISFDQDQTVVERLQSIAATYEYEFYFGFTVTGMTITKKWIKFVKERGVDTEKVISINREISNIKVKESIANLATVIYPTGKDNITLYEYTHDDGDIHTDGLYVVSDSAISKWGRLTRKYSCNASTQADLYSEAVKELKKKMKEETNYEVDISDFPDDVLLGDRINVVDDAGELYLSGRVLTMETSIADQTRKVTLGEWKIKNAGISDKVLELAAEFREIAENRDFYTWIVYADDASGTNMSKTSTGKEYIGIANNKPKEDFEISEVTASMFQWSRIVADDGVGVEDVRVFYKYDSSTPSTPATPTGTLPQIIADVPTGWSLTQPTYNDSGDDMYAVNRIVYSDKTVQYNAITVDESFATSKEAVESANSALVSLSTIQDVVGTLEWILNHGTMTANGSTALDPTKVYFVVDQNGIYEVGGTHYSIVSEPKDADKTSYYILSVDESVQNYVATHVAVTSEGLWLIPDALGGYKILIAVGGTGHIYSTAGTYIIDSNGDIVASFLATGMSVWKGSTELAHIGYGLGNPEGGGTQVQAPYFSFGSRASGSSIGNYSFSEGGLNTASGYMSHAEGKSTKALDTAAHAEGYYTIADGAYSHAEGYFSEAYGHESHASGDHVIADEDDQTAVGRYNTRHVAGSLFTVGCGKSESTRHNAFEIIQNDLATSVDDTLPKAKINELPLIKLIKAHTLETSTMPADSYTANDVRHEITSLVPTGYDVLNITVAGTGYNCVNVYRLTWLWENNKLYIAYRLRNFNPAGTASINVTPYVNIILVNKGCI